MEWWLVTVEEFSGMECDGHMVPHIVAADSAEDADACIPRQWDMEHRRVERLEIPDISFRRKAFRLT